MDVNEHGIFRWETETFDSLTITIYIICRLEGVSGFMFHLHHETSVTNIDTLL
jgi:hypothetical protein